MFAGSAPATDAVHQDLTLVRYLEAGDDLQEGGLTAAAGPDDRHELALVGGHVDAGQRLDQALVAAKRLLKLSQLQFERPIGICHWDEPYLGWTKYPARGVTCTPVTQGARYPSG